MPNIQVKLRRGTDTEHSSFTGAEGEVTVDTTNDTLRVHDGSTAGGIRLAKLSEVSGGTGTVTSVDSGTGLTGGPITTSGTLSLDSIANLSVLGNVSGSSAAPVAVEIKDEDAMTSDSATALATQQSIKAYVDSNAGIPTGTVSAFAGSTAPTGYALCDGSAVNRTTEAALFAVIGTTYGIGDGSTTFNLPDLRGRVIAGQDDMGGTSANRLTNQSGGLNGDTLGATGGSETHTLTTAEMPSHTHAGTQQSGLQADLGSGRLTNDAGNLTGATGGDQAHNNVQPTIILNYIIKK